MHRMIEYAQAEGLARIHGQVLAENTTMLAMCTELGFAITEDPVERGVKVVALDEAMNELAALDPRRSRVVELRYFGGLSVEETAEVLKISPDTVMREWKRAKAWLYTELNRK